MKPIVAISSVTALVGLTVLWVSLDGDRDAPVDVSSEVSSGRATGGHEMSRGTADAPSAQAAHVGIPGPDRRIEGPAAVITKKTGADERWWVPMGPSEFAAVYEQESAWARSKEKRSDADGDGVLSASEKSDAWTEMLVRHFDSDGDGVLNEIERAESEAVMSAKGDEETAWIDESNARLAERLERFDANRDGRLDLDESYAAYLRDVEIKAAWRFRERYDANGDSVIDVSDLESFMALFAENNPRADANDDGAIDERDIEAFEIMMSRSPGP